MRVLALGAHPDDIEFGCGGTLLKLKNFSKIYLFISTKGEMGGDEKVREKEAETVANYLSAELIWGDMKDTYISFSHETIQKVESVIKKILPDLIFVNFYDDTHQDHYALSKATITATRYLKNVLFYEVPSTSPSTFKPDVFCDISDVLYEKLRLLEFHTSQIYKVNVGNLNILEVAKSTANFRGIQARCEYAEAFSPYRLQLIWWKFLVDEKNR